MRLEFLLQADAKAKADSIHARMIAGDRTYARLVATFKISAWAKPYQDLDILGVPISVFWYVNCKPRVSPILTVGEVAALVPYRTG